jgi:hypothetical protein
VHDQFGEATMKTIAGLFSSMAQARSAIERLSAVGLTASIVSGSERPAIKREIAEEVAGESLPQLPDVADRTVPAAGLSAGMVGTTPLTAAEPKQVSPDNIAGSDAFHAANKAPSVDPAANTLPGGVHEALKGYGFAPTDIGQIEAHMRQGDHLLAVDLFDATAADRVIDILRQEGAYLQVVGNRLAAKS